MTQELQQRIEETNEQLVLLLSEDPSVDHKKLEKLTAGLVTHDAKEGNGIDMAKAILRLNRSYTAALAEKEAAPAKPKRKVKTNKAPASAAAPAKKKRGRPKGSKNKKPKAPTTEPPTETTTENPPSE